MLTIILMTAVLSLCLNCAILFVLYRMSHPGATLDSLFSDEPYLGVEPTLRPNKLSDLQGSAPLTAVSTKATYFELDAADAYAAESRANTVL